MRQRTGPGPRLVSRLPGEPHGAVSRACSPISTVYSVLSSHAARHREQPGSLGARPERPSRQGALAGLGSAEHARSAAERYRGAARDQQGAPLERVRARPRAGTPPGAWPPSTSQFGLLH